MVEVDDVGTTLALLLARNWAEGVQSEAACLRLVLKGQLDLHVSDDGEIEFRIPGYSREAESS